jgi:AraC family transcriptional activator of mtrCDE
VVRTRIAGPWGFAADRRDAVVFHALAQGRAFVRRPDAETFELRPGDLVFFPRGAAHEVTSSANGVAMPLVEFITSRNDVVDADSEASVLVCGEFVIDRHLTLPAMRALPPAVHLRADSESSNGSSLTDTLKLLRSELETPNFGNQIVVRNLLSSLFVFFMRRWAETAASQGDWFAAVRSPHTARALACIHEAPERAWTLEDLAKESGLSRAAFARQFCASVGEPPHNYLTRWRMGLAAQLLEKTDLRLGEIAARVGYRSEYSFSRAFKQARGVAPTRFRSMAGSQG